MQLRGGMLMWHVRDPVLQTSQAAHGSALLGVGPNSFSLPPARASLQHTGQGGPPCEQGMKRNSRHSTRAPTGPEMFWKLWTSKTFRKREEDGSGEQ